MSVAHHALRLGCSLSKLYRDCLCDMNLERGPSAAASSAAPPGSESSSWSAVGSEAQAAQGGDSNVAQRVMTQLSALNGKMAQLEAFGGEGIMTYLTKPQGYMESNQGHIEKKMASLEKELGELKDQN